LISHNDVTLMQTLHGKGSTGYENFDSSSDSIISLSAVQGDFGIRKLILTIDYFSV